MDRNIRPGRPRCFLCDAISRHAKGTAPLSLFETASRRFRTRRMLRFVRELGITEQTTVLDIGGTILNWDLIPVRPRLTLLNMPRAREPVPPGVVYVDADGCRLPFADQSFDVVFSNSVIEHLTTWQRQKEFAGEVERVGRRYFVQTPNRWFPVETHLLTPLVHYFPKRLQAPIVRRWTVWSAITGTSGVRRRFYIEHYLDDIRLLDQGSMRGLFPQARVVSERFLGFTKSLIAIRP